MADAPGTPPTPWLDLLDEDIPVVDKAGKKLFVKGLDFVDAAESKRVEAAKPSAPANLPVAPASPAVPLSETLVQKVAPVVSSQPEVSLAKVTRDDFIADAGKDAADLKKIEAIAAAKAVEPQKKAEVTLLDAMVDRGVAESGMPLADEDMKRRFRMLISLFFRDLRDGLETKSKFTMPVQSGGMGMSDADAERVMADLEKKKEEFRSGHAGKAADDKAKYVAERTEKVLGEQDATDKKEQVKMEQAFSGLLQRSGVVASGTAVAPPAASVAAPLKEPKVVTVVGLDTSGKPTAVPASAAPATPAPVQPPPPPAAQPASPPPVPAGAKPVVSDVKYSPKLTGPVEELRSITLKDFR